MVNSLPAVKASPACCHQARASGQISMVKPLGRIANSSGESARSACVKSALKWPGLRGIFFHANWLRWLDSVIDGAEESLIVTPHSNQVRAAVSQPRRWTGRESSSSLEKMMPRTGGED